ncbi:hypothetical protein [Arthrobacter sp. OAP107]|uniref:hypothetical protein n=1 Tax=Arthrobacter sp. OAP107 TaxID=3156445 RepID=UPI003392A4D2
MRTENPPSQALGWAQGAAITHEDAFRAFARALIDELGVPDLLAAKIELLAEYKLDYPQDCPPDDVARMQAELARLRSLQQMLAGPADCPFPDTARGPDCAEGRRSPGPRPALTPWAG